MDETKFIKVVKDLISIESDAQHPAMLVSAITLVERLIKQYDGISIERFEKNGKRSLLAYYGTTRPDTFKLLLNGHVDVVPGKPTQFKPVVGDGTLFGRGAADMKVAAAAMVDVFCRVGKEVSYPLGIQIVTDEEVGGHNGTLHQIEQGVRSKFVLIGEDTPEQSICTDMCGLCWVEVSFHGRRAHSGYAWLGENAILRAHDFIGKLLKIYPPLKKDTWQTTINVSGIHSPNTIYNQVPDSAIVQLDCRYTPNDPHFKDKDSATAF